MGQLSATGVARAADLIGMGGVVAYPTEACFGLGCDPENRSALKRILRIKSRPAGMGMIVIAHCIETVLPYLSIRHEGMLDEPLASWPGPYTWIFPASRKASQLLCANRSTIAVRVTAHPIAAQLTRLADRAIVSTSANRHGRLPLRDYGMVRRQMGSKLDFVVRGPIGRQRNPTEIRDAQSGRLLRAA
ncbi:MAG: L-threonylcarbamoyladenylate synthase [Acidiferrobacterales bacterium]|nr:L-threonylcarbamoyladenylate synthase [Acidiferrobacterales bacterium]